VPNEVTDVGESRGRVPSLWIVEVVLHAGESGGVSISGGGTNTLRTDFLTVDARVDDRTMRFCSSMTTFVGPGCCCTWLIGVSQSPSSGVGVGGKTQTSGISNGRKVEVVLSAGEGAKGSAREGDGRPWEKAPSRRGEEPSTGGARFGVGEKAPQRGGEAMAVLPVVGVTLNLHVGIALAALTSRGAGRDDVRRG
jgi:hypothetical protein